VDDADTREAILSLLARLEQAWQQLDFAAIRRLWDTSQPPIYQAEEALAPSLDWEHLQAYWDLTGRAIERMGMRITSPVTLHALGPDLVTAVYEMHWDALLRSESHAVGGDNRVYATFRRTRDGWRFAQYVESPLAPIVYMRRLYENSVSAGFPRTR
jgi:hypothetical protein